MDFFSFQEKMKQPPGAGVAKKSAREILTVSQLTARIERSIKSALPSIIEVQGEVSNLRVAQSGHMYFSLKDPHNCIDCVMWASDADGLKFEPEDGMESRGFASTKFFNCGFLPWFGRQLSNAGQPLAIARFPIFAIRFRLLEHLLVFGFYLVTMGLEVRHDISYLPLR